MQELKSGALPFDIARYALLFDGRNTLKAGRDREDSFVLVETKSRQQQPAQLLEIIAHTVQQTQHVFVKVEWYQYTGVKNDGFSQIRVNKTDVTETVLPLKCIIRPLFAVTSWQGQPDDGESWWLVPSDSAAQT